MQPEEYEQLDDNEKMGAEQSRPAGQKPPLRPIEGGGGGDGQARGRLSTVGDELPGGPSADQKASETAGRASRNPNNPLRIVDGGSNRPAQPNAPKGILKALSKRRKLLLVGALGSGITALIVGLILALIPLKLEFMMKGLERKYFSQVDNMVEKREERLFERYVNKVLLKKLEGATSAEINSQILTGSYAGDLFKNWYVDKFEEKMATQSGIRFAKTKQPVGGGKPKFNVQFADGTSFEFNGEFRYDNMSNKQARQAIKTAVHEQTKSRNVIRRRYARHLLMKKYGVKRWRLFEDSRDHIGDKTFDARKKVKLALIDKVIGPFSENYATIFKCVVSGCKPEELPSNLDANPANIDSDLSRIQAQTGTRNDRKATDLNDPNSADQHAVDNAQTQVADAASTDVAGAASNAGDAALADEIKSSITKEVLKKVASGIGVAEIIYHIDNFLRNDTYRKIMESRNKQQYANVFAAFRSADDEMKAGHLSFATLGVLSTNLNGMEKSRVYQNDFQLPKSTGTKICGDGSQLPAGQLVCPDKQITPPAGFAQDYVNSPVGKIIGPIAKVYGGTIHVLVSLVGSVIGTALNPVMEFATGIVSQVTGFTSEDLAKAVESVLSTFIGPIVTGSEVGADLFDAIAGGADTVSQDMLHFTLGGMKLTPIAAKQVNEQIAAEQAEKQKNMSFIARLTNTDNPYSVGSRLLASIPMGASTWANNFSHLAATPFASMGDIFFKLPYSSVYAADASDNPFNNDRYGRPADFNYDYNPDDYTPEKCKVIEDDWVKNHMYKGDAINNCRLELVTTTAAGSFSTSKDDGGIGDSGNSNTAGTSGAAGETVSGDGIDLAKKLLVLSDQGKVKFADYSEDPNSDRADRSLASQQMADIADGKPASGTTRCGFAVPKTIQPNPKLLAFMVDLAGSESYTVNTLFGQCHSGPSSNHYKGEALDFGCPLDTAKADAIGKKYGISHNDEACGGKNNHWHYSIGGN